MPELRLGLDQQLTRPFGVSDSALPSELRLFDLVADLAGEPVEVRLGDGGETAGRQSSSHLHPIHPGA
jgi:hypothetical protein